MGDGPTTADRLKLRLGGFQIKLLVFAAALTALAGGGLAWDWMDRQKSADDTSHIAPEGARTFLNDASQRDHADEPEETWRHWLSTKGAKIGLSFLGGFAIGYVMRLFLKTAIMVFAVGAAVLLALSYFQVFNIDFSAAREEWTTTGEWLSEQAGKAKDFLWTYLPSSTSAIFGMGFGMNRK